MKLGNWPKFQKLHIYKLNSSRVPNFTLFCSTIARFADITQLLTELSQCNLILTYIHICISKQEQTSTPYKRSKQLSIYIHHCLSAEHSRATMSDAAFQAPDPVPDRAELSRSASSAADLDPQQSLDQIQAWFRHCTIPGASSKPHRAPMWFWRVSQNWCLLEQAW